jgi:hypothetical protein
MEKLGQPGHVLVKKAPVLTDGVATHRRDLGRHVLGKEIERLLLGLGGRDLARAHPGGEAGATVLPGIPLVHRGQNFVALMNRQYRPLHPLVQR